MSTTSWRPNRKIMAAAVATIFLFVVSLVWPDVDIAVGIEAALVTVVAYLIPNPSA